MRRILVVEDEPALVRMVSRTLRQQGIMSVTAGSMHEAEQRLEQAEQSGQKFDVVLLDLDLPDCKGEATVWRLKYVLPEPVPIVVLSGTLDEEIRESLRRSGIHRIITKPHHPSELVEVIEAAMKPDSDPPRSGDERLDYFAMRMLDKFSHLIRGASKSMQTDIEAKLEARDNWVRAEFTQVKSDVKLLKTAVLGDDDTPPAIPSMPPIVVRRFRDRRVDWAATGKMIGVIVASAITAGLLTWKAINEARGEPKPSPAPTVQAPTP